MTELRRKRKMTQGQLAESMGVTQTYISQIKNGYTGMLDNLVDYVQGVNGRLKLEIIASDDYEDEKSGTSTSLSLESEMKKNSM
ncbi:helix-turn-helix domain-containing protein [Alloscardovia sp. HMSC034E08]|uniref:helix-turn-helix domain-containing protein n=1 Tax=Alloscardovia sp. HMSC034E08 TaxID=1739413 RepID=UPI0008F92D0D|nr:helix-turn-helix transcriptional regulator [Alloscardovia sp. HMSC034E08]